MNKKLIKLTEKDLHKIVKQSVNKVLKEENYGDIPNMIGNNRTSKSNGCNSSDRMMKMMRKKNAAKAIKEAQVILSSSHEARLRTVVGELAQQIGSILRKLTMYDRGMNNYLADLVQNEKWVDDLYGVYYSMKEFAEATPQVDASAPV